MAGEEHSFLEYLRLQDDDGDPRLYTKSELMAAVRDHGYSISDRQLTFYVSEGLMPKSVRVGTRSGVYPAIVAEMLGFILDARERGIPIEAIKELVPIWKFVVKARKEQRLDLMEFEDRVRTSLTNFDAMLALPFVVQDVMLNYCTHCRGEVKIVDKHGESHSINDHSTTIGFAMAQKVENEDGTITPRLFGRTRITLAYTDPNEDPTTVRVGTRPDEEFPTASLERHGAGHGVED